WGRNGSRGLRIRSRSTGSCSRAGYAAAWIWRPASSRRSSGGRASSGCCSMRGSACSTAPGRPCSCGEPGVGKSRLVYELRERLCATPHTWLECRCSPYTQGTAFRPWRGLGPKGLRLEPWDGAAENPGKLEQALGGAGFSLEETVPLFAASLSIPLGASYPPLDLHPDV